MTIVIIYLIIGTILTYMDSQNADKYTRQGFEMNGVNPDMVSESMYKFIFYGGMIFSILTWPRIPYIYAVCFIHNLIRKGTKK